MLILTKEQKKAHSIASKIPHSFWWEHFRSRFDDSTLQITNLPFHQVTQKNLPQSNIQALILLLICYPDIPATQSLSFARDQLYLSLQQIFNIAAVFGRIDILALLKGPNLPGMIKNENYIAFRDAAANGQEVTLEWCKEQAPDELIAMIKAADYYAFYWAAEHGHLHILQWLRKQAPDEFTSMVRANNYYPFRTAAAEGHVHVMQWLKEEAPAEWVPMLKDDKFNAFLGAAAYGHVKALRWLKDQAPDELMAMIRSEYYYGFRLAVAHGQLEVLKWYKDQAPDELNAMIKAENHALHLAAINGHKDVLQWLKEQAPDEVMQIIKTDNYYALRGAAEDGHLQVLQWYKKEAPHEFNAMLAAHYYDVFNDAFKRAFTHGHFDTVNWFLHSPECLAYTEWQLEDYGAHIKLFIQDTVAALQQEAADGMSHNPHSIFDISDAERARHCFYMLRNIIRRNDRSLDDALRFLLNIPSVKALAHQTVTEGRPNELMQLALTTGNQIASETLLNIDAVRALAAVDDFYREQIQYDFDLKQMSFPEDKSNTIDNLDGIAGSAQLLMPVQPHNTSAVQATIRLGVFGITPTSKERPVTVEKRINNEVCNSPGTSS